VPPVEVQLEGYSYLASSFADQSDPAWLGVLGQVSSDTVQEGQVLAWWESHRPAIQQWRTRVVQELFADHRNLAWLRDQMEQAGSFQQLADTVWARLIEGQLVRLEAEDPERVAQLRAQLAALQGRVPQLRAVLCLEAIDAYEVTVGQEIGIRELRPSQRWRSELRALAGQLGPAAGSTGTAVDDAFRPQPRGATPIARHPTAVPPPPTAIPQARHLAAVTRLQGRLSDVPDVLPAPHRDVLRRLITAQVPGYLDHPPEAAARVSAELQGQFRALQRAWGEPGLTTQPSMAWLGRYPGLQTRLFQQETIDLLLAAYAGQTVRGQLGVSPIAEANAFWQVWESLAEQMSELAGVRPLGPGGIARSDPDEFALRLRQLREHAERVRAELRQAGSAVWRLSEFQHGLTGLMQERPEQAQQLLAGIDELLTMLADDPQAGQLGPYRRLQAQLRTLVSNPGQLYLESRYLRGPLSQSELGPLFSYEALEDLWGRTGPGQLYGLFDELARAIVEIEDAARAARNELPHESLAGQEAEDALIEARQVRAAAERAEVGPIEVYYESRRRVQRLEAELQQLRAELAALQRQPGPGQPYGAQDYEQVRAELIELYERGQIDYRTLRDRLRLQGSEGPTPRALIEEQIFLLENRLRREQVRLERLSLFRYGFGGRLEDALTRSLTQTVGEARQGPAALEPPLTWQQALRRATGEPWQFTMGMGPGHGYAQFEVRGPARGGLLPVHETPMGGPLAVQPIASLSPEAAHQLAIGLQGVMETVLGRELPGPGTQSARALTHWMGQFQFMEQLAQRILGSASAGPLPDWVRLPVQLEGELGRRYGRTTPVTELARLFQPGEAGWPMIRRIMRWANISEGEARREFQQELWSDLGRVLATMTQHLDPTQPLSQNEFLDLVGRRLLGARRHTIDRRILGHLAALRNLLEQAAEGFGQRDATTIASIYIAHLEGLVARQQTPERLRRQANDLLQFIQQVGGRSYVAGLWTQEFHEVGTRPDVRVGQFRADVARGLTPNELTDLAGRAVGEARAELLEGLTERYDPRLAWQVPNQEQALLEQIRTAFQLAGLDVQGQVVSEPGAAAPDIEAGLHRFYLNAARWIDAHRQMLMAADPEVRQQLMGTLLEEYLTESAGRGRGGQALYTRLVRQLAFLAHEVALEEWGYGDGPRPATGFRNARELGQQLMAQILPELTELAGRYEGPELAEQMAPDVIRARLRAMVANYRTDPIEQLRAVLDRQVPASQVLAYLQSLQLPEELSEWPLHVLPGRETPLGPGQATRLLEALSHPGLQPYVELGYSTFRLRVMVRDPNDPTGQNFIPGTVRSMGPHETVVQTDIGELIRFPSDEPRLIPVNEFASYKLMAQHFQGAQQAARAGAQIESRFLWHPGTGGLAGVTGPWGWDPVAPLLLVDVEAMPGVAPAGSPLDRVLQLAWARTDQPQELARYLNPAGAAQAYANIVQPIVQPPPGPFETAYERAMELIQARLEAGGIGQLTPEELTQVRSYIEPALLRARALGQLTGEVPELTAENVEEWVRRVGEFAQADRQAFQVAASDLGQVQAYVRPAFLHARAVGWLTGEVPELTAENASELVRQAEAIYERARAEGLAPVPQLLAQLAGEAGPGQPLRVAGINVQFDVARLIETVLSQVPESDRPAVRAQLERTLAAGGGPLDLQALLRLLVPGRASYELEEVMKWPELAPFVAQLPAGVAHEAGADVQRTLAVWQAIRAGALGPSSAAPPVVVEPGTLLAARPGSRALITGHSRRVGQFGGLFALEGGGYGAQVLDPLWPTWVMGQSPEQVVQQLLREFSPITEEAAEQLEAYTVEDLAARLVRDVRTRPDRADLYQTLFEQYRQAVASLPEGSGQAAVQARFGQLVRALAQERAEPFRLVQAQQYLHDPRGFQVLGRAAGQVSQTELTYLAAFRSRMLEQGVVNRGLRQALYRLYAGSLEFERLRGIETETWRSFFQPIPELARPYLAQARFQFRGQTYTLAATNLMQLQGSVNQAMREIAGQVLHQPELAPHEVYRRIRIEAGLAEQFEDQMRAWLAAGQAEVQAAVQFSEAASHQVGWDRPELAGRAEQLAEQLFQPDWLRRLTTDLAGEYEPVQLADPFGRTGLAHEVRHTGELAELELQRLAVELARDPANAERLTPHQIYEQLQAQYRAAGQARQLALPGRRVSARTLLGQLRGTIQAGFGSPDPEMQAAVQAAQVELSRLVNLGYDEDLPDALRSQIRAALGWRPGQVPYGQWIIPTGQYRGLTLAEMANLKGGPRDVFNYWRGLGQRAAAVPPDFRYGLVRWLEAHVESSDLPEATFRELQAAWDIAPQDLARTRMAGLTRLDALVGRVEAEAAAAEAAESVAAGATEAGAQAYHIPLFYSAQLDQAAGQLGADLREALDQGGSPLGGPPERAYPEWARWGTYRPWVYGGSLALGGLISLGIGIHLLRRMAQRSTDPDESEHRMPGVTVRIEGHGRVRLSQVELMQQLQQSLHHASPVPIQSSGLWYDQRQPMARDELDRQLADLLGPRRP